MKVSPAEENKADPGRRETLRFDKDKGTTREAAATAERNVGSWSTDADGAKPGDPPAGWQDGGGQQEVAAASTAAAAPNSAVHHARASGPRMVVRRRRRSSLAVFQERTVFWWVKLRWQLVIVIALRIALLVHCACFAAWVMFGMELIFPSSGLTQEDIDDGSRGYRFRYAALFMGMYEHGAAWTLLALLAGAFVFGCYGLVRVVRTDIDNLHLLDEDVADDEHARRKRDAHCSKSKAHHITHHVMSMRGAKFADGLAAIELFGGLLQVLTLHVISTRSELGTSVFFGAIVWFDFAFCAVCLMKSRWTNNKRLRIMMFWSLTPVEVLRNT